MIVEKILCDYENCNAIAEMDGGMVPDSWVRFDGKHYCLPMHFVLAVDVLGGV